MVPRARACKFSSVTSRFETRHQRRQRLLEPLDRVRDRHDVVVDAERARDLGGIVERFLRGEAVGQHHAAHALRPQRIDRHRRAQRGIDAAGEADDDAGKAVLVDIVAHAEHAGGVVGLVAGLERRDGTAAAGPAVGRAREYHRRHRLAERRELRAEGQVGVEHEGGALEHELVLAADLVDVDERQAGVLDARHRHVEPLVDDAAPVGRAVRHQQNLAAGLADAFDRLRAPDVLADRHADAQPAEIDRPRHLARPRTPASRRTRRNSAGRP